MHISKNLAHLGIVSGVCKKIGLVEEINCIVGVDPRQKVTCGQAVVAMVLNALGFVDRPLYLFPEFLETKPVELLIGPGFTSEDFNDDVLGRTLDKLSVVGLEETFMRVAASAQTYAGDDDRFFHSDTTSMSVHGEYDRDDEDEPVPIQITYGYPKDHRTDLKQFVVSLITSKGLPVFIQGLSGNTSDKDHFRELSEMYGMMLRTTWGRDRIWVWDSAFYTKKNLQALPPDMVWITRVPETLTLAQKLLQNAENMTATSMKGYSIQSTMVTYAGVQQRWIVVLSEQAYNREKKTLKKKTQQEKEMVKTALWHLSHQEFRCREDGLSALQELTKKWKYHRTQKIDLVEKQRKKNGGKGRPKTEDPKTTVYLVTATAQENDVEIHRCLQSLGRFIVATKELNAEKLSDEDTVKAYKDQQQVERGFRFLKDPLFFAHAIFLKTERRIQAMVMIMGLALLIYAIAEKKLRDALKTMDETLPDQRGKPTKTPTMRRMFQTFEGVSVLYNEQGEQLEIMNLSETSRKVLLLFGEEYMEAYGLK